MGGYGGGFGGGMGGFGGRGGYGRGRGMGGYRGGFEDRMVGNQGMDFNKPEYENMAMPAVMPNQSSMTMDMPQNYGRRNRAMPDYANFMGFDPFGSKSAQTGPDQNRQGGGANAMAQLLAQQNLMA
jgi:hypothetical protein